MKDEKTSVSQYGIFDSAISTTSTLNTAVDTCKGIVDKAKSDLGNNLIFEGPLCNECINAFGDVVTKISEMTNYCSQIKDFLVKASNDYQSTDSNNSKNVQATSKTTSNTNYSGKVSLDGNTIVIDKPVEKGNKYNLSQEDLEWLANVAVHEQGSLEGAKMELSLMANLYEKHKDNYSDVRSYVQNSGWFSSHSMTGEIPSQEYIDAAEEVLNEGNLYVPSNVDEHDCLQDIASISTGDVYNPDDYIPYETVITNNMGSTYTFVGFAPNGGDPFGYIEK